MSTENTKDAGLKAPRVVVVMPAYNAAATLAKTCHAIPQGCCDAILLVDDASRDDTPKIARSLNLEVIEHPTNLGYGANQKTCYTHALAMGAQIVVMLHPDYQYDPRIIPDLVKPIETGEADVVLASRMLGDPLGGGMPLYKYAFNKILTWLQNKALGTAFTEFHTGYRAFSRKALETVRYRAGSNDFVFDNEIIVQCLYAGLKFKEIPVSTRYAEDSSSVGLFTSLKYGLGVIRVTLTYLLHKKGVIKSRLLG